MQVERLCLLLALACASGQADIRDCPGISIDGYKVMVDGMSLLGPMSADTKLLLNRLRQKVQLDVEAVRLETTPKMVVVPCVARTPEDVSEFTPTVVDSLNGHRVLVEVWGELDLRSGVALQKAQLNFTLVPISFYDQPLVPAGGFSASYKQRLSGNPEEVVKLFGEFSDLKAYVSITAGVKLLKEHEYDKAFPCFCTASSILDSGPAGMKPEVRTALRAYVDRMVEETFTKARAELPPNSKLILEGTRPVCLRGLP